MASQEVVARLEKAVQQLETLVKTASVGNSRGSEQLGSPDSMAPATAGELDALLANSLSKLVSDAESQGDKVVQQVAAVKSAFDAMCALVATAAISKKPDQSGLQALVKPLQESIAAVVAVKDSSRASPQFNLLALVAEGIPALGWVVVEPTPVPYIAEMKDAAQFYVNRVIKEFKGKDESPIAWANAFLALLEELKAYVKKSHTTGLTWNPKGQEAKAVPAPAAPSPTPAPAAAAPAPAKSGPPSGFASSLASALNKTDLTSGLRKVDKSEMTHKNPELRVVSTAGSTAAPAAAPKKFGAQVKKDPVLRLDGNKWVVENHTNAAEPIVVENTELRHVVYIYGCTASTIQIKGKVNAVTLDNCKKVGLVVDTVVSTVDVVNCKSCQLQITGKAPTTVIDKTDGMQLYLSRETLDIEILTAKSSEMNVVFEDPKTAPGQAEYIEKPVSEQFKTKIVDGNLVTTCVEHKG